MRIAALNIQHGGGARTQAITDYLKSLDADCIVLSEYRLDDNGLATQLGLLGYTYQHTGAQYPKENSVLVVSKTPFAVGNASQRIASVAFQDLTLLGVYFPQGEEKRPVFHEIRKMVDSGSNALVIGDFNTGKPFIDEDGDSFACVDEFEALEHHGLIDAWRTRNPEGKEFTWYSNKGNGFRIDHAFCTASLNDRISLVEYLHDPREQKVTDHSALIVELSLLGTKPIRKYICPACKEKAGVNIEYGMPSEEAFAASQRGEIALGGCVIDYDNPERRCLKCGHEWLIKRRPLPI